MKKFFTIVGVIIAFVTILLVAIFFLTSGITDSADDFFKNVKAKNYSDAYSNLSVDFKKATSEEDFIIFLKSSGLIGFKSSFWNSRSIENSRGKLYGTVKTENSSIKTTINFIKEDGDWKIFSIKTDNAGLQNRDFKTNNNIPPEKELVILVDESLNKFAHSVNMKNFKGFHSYIAHLWSKQVTIEKLNTIFKVFMDNNINLLPLLKSSSPTFTSKPTLKKGILMIKGYYPTKSTKIVFELDYIHEGLSWKLIRINIKLTK